MTSDNHLPPPGGLRRYAANTLWIVSEKSFRTVVSFIVAVWVARHLGPDNYGILNFAQSFVFLFSALANLGLDSIVVRELVRDEDRRPLILGSAFALKLGGAILTFPILAVTILLTSADASTRLMVFIVALSLVFQSMNVLDFYFQSQVLSRYVAIANTVSATVSALFKIGLILTDAPLIAFAAMFALDTLILVAGMAYFYLKTGGVRSRWRFDSGIARSLLSESAPLILSGLIISLYARIDQVMINELVGSDAVGRYAVAIRISETYYLIPLAITSSLFPALVTARDQDRERYHWRLQGLYDILTWAALAATVVIVPFGNGLIAFLFGNAYEGAGIVLRIHMFAAVLVSAGLVSNKFFSLENRQRHILYRSLIGIVTNVALNLVLIPAYGIAGAATATIVTQFATTYFYTAVAPDVRILARMSLRSYNLVRVLRELPSQLEAGKAGR